MQANTTNCSKTISGDLVDFSNRKKQTANRTPSNVQSLEMTLLII